MKNTERQFLKVSIYNFLDQQIIFVANVARVWHTHRNRDNTNQYQLYKPRNFVSRDKNGMHAWWIRESFTRHNYSRRKQTESDYEIWIFIYPPFKKHLGFRERLPAPRKYPLRSIKSAWQDSSFMARGVMAEGTAGRRLGSKVFRERPIHAKTVYIMIHWTAKQAPRIVRRYGRNMWGNRMVILCETNCSANSCRCLDGGKS